MEDGPARGTSEQKTMASAARRSISEPDTPAEDPHTPTSSPSDVSWGDVSEFDGSYWAEWQFPVLIVLFASVGFIAVTFVMLIWLKSQMLLSKKQKDCEEPDHDPGAGTGTEEKSKSLPAVAEADQGWACQPAFHKCSSLTLQPQNIEKVEALLPDALRQSVVVAGPSTSAQVPSEGLIEPQIIPRFSAETRAEPVRVKAKGLLERRGSSASLTIDLLHPSQENISSLTAPTRECTTEEYLLSAGKILSRKQLQDRLKDGMALHREFYDIPSNFSEQVEVAGSGAKNRYKSIIPNEHSRVRLPTPGSDGSDAAEDQLCSYINANYVKGYDGEERAFIATQGPLPHTVEDFWQMVWAERVPAIVMITKLVEKRRHKCEAYIPTEEERSDSSPDSPHVYPQVTLGGPGSSAAYGDITVYVKKVSVKDGYAVRELRVQRRDEFRTVRHYWYDTWPDHKTPPTPHEIVQLVEEVEADRRRALRSEPHAPVVVHCSAGIGRTGCFLAVAIGACQLSMENRVDVLGTVCRLRHDRGGMVQTGEQYEFIHRALDLFGRSLPDICGE